MDKELKAELDRLYFKSHAWWRQFADEIIRFRRSRAFEPATFPQREALTNYDVPAFVQDVLTKQEATRLIAYRGEQVEAYKLAMEKQTEASERIQEEKDRREAERFYRSTGKSYVDLLEESDAGEGFQKEPIERA